MIKLLILLKLIFVTKDHKTKKTLYVSRFKLMNKFRKYVNEKELNRWGGKFFWNENNYIFTDNCRWRVTLNPIEWSIRIEDIDYDGCNINMNMDIIYKWNFVVKYNNNLYVAVTNPNKNYRYTFK